MAELNEVQKPEIAETKLTAAVDELQVVAFLKGDPMLLTRHPQLLEALELTHASGSAVSLIERQVELLRGKNARLESRLERLIESARDNEVRAEKVLRLAHTLIRSPSLAAIAAGLRASMREDFDVDDVFLGINGTMFKRHDIDGVTPIAAMKVRLSLILSLSSRYRAPCGLSATKPSVHRWMLCRSA